MTRHVPKFETLAAFKVLLKAVPDESLGTFLFLHQILLSFAQERGAKKRRRIDNLKRCVALKRRIGLIERRLRKAGCAKAKP